MTSELTVELNQPLWIITLSIKKITRFEVWNSHYLWKLFLCCTKNIFEWKNSFINHFWQPISRIHLGKMHFQNEKKNSFLKPIVCFDSSKCIWFQNALIFCWLFKTFWNSWFNPECILKRSNYKKFPWILGQFHITPSLMKV